ncbi:MULTISPECIES: type IA DNA topoisomerase [Metabacillus]|uniref:type IA DNA topoisomerase n=1 Tax=Metabacillus TaxID=2675233 RepID=UPI000C7FA3A6|nr:MULTISPECIES: type IA DNA topoisomerase [Metabacillus]MCM3443965.1 DNA topoisomerase [Metabacillus halosaccharovorans]PMC34982.1 DNA topoisomerase III [Bacillus sp. UMB0899]
MFLLIFEKPQQARTVCKAFDHKDMKKYIEIRPNEFFSKGAIGVWCIGHLLRAYTPGEYKEEWKEWSISQLPLIPENFSLKLKVDEKKTSAFSEVRKWINDKRIETIINCSDPGREGILLTASLLKYVNNRKPVKRLWTTSLTKSAVKKAFKQLKDEKEYLNIYYEAHSRQVSDWIIGMSASRAVSILAQQKGIKDKSGFSLGRCQTPLVSIIHRREKEIENFKAIPYWDLYLSFRTKNNEVYQGRWFKEGEEHIWDKVSAEALTRYIQNKPSQVAEVSNEKKEIPPPQFYNLTELQFEANKKYQYSPNRVLSIAQSLYDKEFMTYPRSSPRVVSQEEAKGFPEVLEKLSHLEEYSKFFPTPLNDISGNKRFVNDKGVDDHHAIIPTETPPSTLEVLNKDEKRIYDMVVKTFIAAHFPHAVYSQSEIQTLVDQQFLFKSKGTRLVSEGWKSIYSNEYNEVEDDSAEEVQTLPIVEVNELVSSQDMTLKEGVTKPPKRFTAGQLVKVMSNAGAYLTKEEKEGFTNKELCLGTVATQANIIKQVFDKGYAQVKSNKVYLNPKGDLLMRMLGENNWLASPVTTGRMENFLEDIGKGKQPYKRFLQATNERITQFVQDQINQSEHWNFEEIINEMHQSTIVGSCMYCGSGVIDKGKFFGCESYSKTQCSFSFSKEVAGKKITNSQAAMLLEKGTTPLIKGFKKKNKEETFDAFLVWDPNQKKVTFSFEGVPTKR